MTNLPIQRRRHGKIIKKAAEALGCSRKLIYTLVVRQVLVCRLHNEAEIAQQNGDEDRVLELTQLAHLFESEAQ